MVSYGSTSRGYQVVGYGNSSTSNYSVTTTTWKKTTCCGSFKAGQRCTDCPA